MEKDDDAGAYDFGARLYNPQIGRWWSVDPKESKYPMFSPYHVMGNNPIFLNDATGGNGELTIKKGNKNAEKAEDKVNKIIIKQTHYYQQDIIDMYNEARKGGVVISGNDWQTTANEALTKELNRGNPFKTTIDGEEWLIEFEIDVKKFEGTEDEFKKFIKEHPEANIYVPLTGESGKASGSSASGRTAFVNNLKIKRTPKTIVHEFFHNLGLDHDDTKEGDFYSIMSYRFGLRKIIDNDLKLLVTDALQLSKNIERQTIKVLIETNHQTRMNQYSTIDDSGEKKVRMVPVKGNGKT